MRSSRTLGDLKGNISERTIDFLSLIVIAFRILKVLEGSQSASLWPLFGNLSEKTFNFIPKTTNKQKDTHRNKNSFTKWAAYTKVSCK